MPCGRAAAEADKSPAGRAAAEADESPAGRAAAEADKSPAGRTAPGHAAPGLGAAFGLALAAAVSLGLARFSYALLLPPMRADLGWSYFTAGTMNTVNAAGYLLGALLAPRVLVRRDARAVLLAGGAAAALLLVAHAAVRSDAALMLLRGLTGVASAASFVGGGLLAARLAGVHATRAGLVLGVYYGGVGLGIVVSALIVPAFSVPALVPAAGADAAGAARAAARWPAAWAALGIVAFAATLVTAAATRALHAPPAPGNRLAPFPLRAFVFALAGYALFGVGYIGYMTFIVTLLREQGQPAGVVVAFYVLLGCGAVASSWLWSGLLQRHRSGLPLALLNALLALATALPVAWTARSAVFASGLLFGGVFLSVVASTTALVRHNCASAAWPAGIGAFTIVFAAGQIVGPSLVGLIADGPGGLERGFVLSATALALGALLAALQRPLAR
ncbi:MAG: YbfB/YjiJ family MFS transporter [Rubrivivax sp.]|nr:YbfB/YjiJ family MFS transporter [Rubrivivax sp.]